VLINYLKIALKVLARRRFFTAISLFGVAFTLMMVLIVTAAIDHTLSPRSPEVHLDRTLHVSFIMARLTRGDETREAWTYPGYRLLDRYARNLPGVEKESIFSLQRPATSFLLGEKEEFEVRSTDGPYWEILDFAFLEGGPFTARDDEDGNRVAVINCATRQRVFEDRAAIGRNIELDGTEYRIVGVVEDVGIARSSAVADVWIPHGARKSQEFREGIFGSFSALLLAEGRERFGEIRRELESRLAHVDPGGEWSAAEIVGTARTRLQEMAAPTSEEEFRNPPVGKLVWQFIGGVLLWMLLPAVNLVSLNMSRIIERSSEIGVRKAFGASSRDLVGQFILENVFLCIVGGLIALGGAVLVIRAVEASALLPYTEIRLNFRVFLYALGFACLFGVLSGAFPAWRMSRLHPVEALRGGAR
jgi:putative ABC transport system permease protein